MTGTWEQHYAEAKAYYEQNGHLEVSCHSSLYVWLSEQRYARRGKRGTLTGEQIALLDNLGMRWESRRAVYAKLSIVLPMQSSRLCKVRFNIPYK